MLRAILLRLAGAVPVLLLVSLVLFGPHPSGARRRSRHAAAARCVGCRRGTRARQMGLGRAAARAIWGFRRRHLAARFRHLLSLSRARDEAHRGAVAGDDRACRHRHSPRDHHGHSVGRDRGVAARAADRRDHFHRFRRRHQRADLLAGDRAGSGGFGRAQSASVERPACLWRRAGAGDRFRPDRRAHRRPDPISSSMR